MKTPFKSKKDAPSVEAEKPAEAAAPGVATGPSGSKVEVDDVSPEVKSYIYQTLMEFEPYTTPSTIVSVIARDPLKLITQFEADGVEYDQTKLKKMFRISISLKEDGNKIEDEAVHEDLYTAIRMAKDKLLKTLIEIHDSVVSNQDRTAEINGILQNGNVH